MIELIYYLKCDKCSNTKMTCYIGLEGITCESATLNNSRYIVNIKLHVNRYINQNSKLTCSTSCNNSAMLLHSWILFISFSISGRRRVTYDVILRFDQKRV